MAYKELIGSFDEVRDYIREFFIYGIKKRSDFSDKSGRTYDNRRRQIESWLDGYMSFQQSASGKAQIISVDSREVVHNPLYKAFKTKNFSDYDILLHFCILDMLAGGKELAFRNIAGELQEYGFSGEENVINERTIRLKLQEYEKLGILKVRTEGKKKQYYSLSADAVDLVSWQDAIEFFSETEPMGIVGSFLLDRKELAGCPSSFWYKHHYMLHAIDSEIVETILEGIAEKKYLELVAIGKKQQERKIKLYPIKLYVSTRNGREYVLGHVSGAAGLDFIRVDRIKKVKTGIRCDEYQKFENEYQANKSYLWGVSSGSAKDITHIEMTVRAAEGEEFIVRRLEREKRNGHVYKITDQQYKYVVDTYDAMELMPWIRTFMGRIEKLESSNPQLKKKFDQDMEQLYSMYFGEVQNDIS